MRLTLVYASALAVCLGALAPRSLAWEATYVSEAIDNGLEAAKVMKDLSGYQPRSDGFCLVGGWLEKGKHLALKVQLKKGKEYIFIGGADEDAKDLDLEALDGAESIAADEDDDNTPIVVIEAERSAECTLRLTLFDADEPVFCVLVMLESGGTKGSLDRLAGTVTQLAAGVDAIKGEDEYELEKGKGAISLAACLLDSGGKRTLLREFSRKDEYVIVGSGDKGCVDLDISVKKDGDEVSDEDDDATPVVNFTVGGPGRAELTLTMFEAKGPSFAVAAIMTRVK